MIDLKEEYDNWLEALRKDAEELEDEEDDCPSNCLWAVVAAFVSIVIASILYGVLR